LAGNLAFFARLERVAVSDYSKRTLRITNSQIALEVVPEFGGLLNRLDFTTAAGKVVSVVAGLAGRAQMMQNNQYRGVPLYPFPNRLDAGAYHHHGASYQLECNEAELNNNLHGFLYKLTPEVRALTEGDTASDIVLGYRYDGSLSGYPFAADIEQAYRLAADASLTMTYRVTNLHGDVVPVGLGWHPYFSLGCSADDLELQLPPVQRLLMNERMLPSGEVEPFEYFRDSRRIADWSFDDNFVLCDAGSITDVTTTIWNPQGPFGLQLSQVCGDRAYNYLQVFIPPDRKSIAIEPMTCGVNAFNTGAGLIELDPGAVLEVSCRVQLIERLP
jgi:Galactose mutarotase and related enzymes